MSPRSRKALSLEDRILWQKVARSVTPLAGKTIDDEEAETEEFSVLLQASRGSELQPLKPQARQVATTIAPVRPHAQPQSLDRPTRMRLAKGRLPIEGKVDLHGLTQREAHSLLLSFLRRAQEDGRRHVLVVTGKGTSLGSEGVLRRAVPGWLATPPFRLLVSGHEWAATRHGGAGALYVRLRRSERLS